MSSQVKQLESSIQKLPADCPLASNGPTDKILDARLPAEGSSSWNQLQIIQSELFRCENTPLITWNNDFCMFLSPGKYQVNSDMVMAGMFGSSWIFSFFNEVPAESKTISTSNCKCTLKVQISPLLMHLIKQT